MSIKLVIFDLDGTLVDAYPAIVQSFNKTMKAVGRPPQKSRVIRRAVGWGDKNLLKPFVATRDLNRALAIYRQDHQKALAQKTRFLPGAKQLLSGLIKRKYKLAVASNRPTKFSLIILRHLKVEKYFDYILCGDKIKRAKPHPDIILRILKRLSVDPSEAIYVGDMTVDVKAGNRAKVKTIAVLGGSSTRKELARLHPYKIINNVECVSGILRYISLNN